MALGLLSGKVECQPVGGLEPILWNLRKRHLKSAAVLRSDKYIVRMGMKTEMLMRATPALTETESICHKVAAIDLIDHITASKIDDTYFRAMDSIKDTILKCPKLCSNYQLIEIIGQGSFGAVVLGLRRPGKEKVAIKIMKHSIIGKSQEFCQDPAGSGSITPTEILLQKFLPPHQNIIRFIESWYESGYWFLVCEYHGYKWSRLSGCSSIQNQALLSANDQLSQNELSLAGLLRSCGGLDGAVFRLQHKGPLLPSHIQKIIFRQIALAIKFLHDQGLLHRDLKDENVLVDEFFNVKLIDFGHATFFRHDRENGLVCRNNGFTAYGTQLFAPPETRSGMRYRGPEGDMYALGLMIYEANYGDLPARVLEARYCELGKSIFTFDERHGFSDKLVADLCEKLLCPNPNMRLTIEETVAYPWFQY